MAQGSRQIQSQAQQQVQTLSPQQILVVKLLELPAVELEDRIHAELLENPALEEGKEENATDNEYSDTENAEDGMDSDANDYDSLSDYLTEDDIPDYKLQENNRSKDEQAEDIPFSDSTSFYEILKEQLRERRSFFISSRNASAELRKFSTSPFESIFVTLSAVKKAFCSSVSMPPRMSLTPSVTASVLSRV